MHWVPGRAETGTESLTVPLAAQSPPAALALGGDAEQVLCPHEEHLEGLGGPRGPPQAA